MRPRLQGLTTSESLSLPTLYKMLPSAAASEAFVTITLGARTRSGVADQRRYGPAIRLHDKNAPTQTPCEKDAPKPEDGREEQ